MALTFDSAVGSVKANKQAKYLGQRSLSSKLVFRYTDRQTDRQTNRHTRWTDWPAWATKVVVNSILNSKWWRTLTSSRSWSNGWISCFVNGTKVNDEVITWPGEHSLFYRLQSHEFWPIVLVLFYGYAPCSILSLEPRREMRSDKRKQRNISCNRLKSNLVC